MTELTAATHQAALVQLHGVAMESVTLNVTCQHARWTAVIVSNVKTVPAQQATVRGIARRLQQNVVTTGKLEMVTVTLG
jgi:hypothetical protein